MVRSSFSAESSGYKLRGNICRKNVVGLVLWDNRQFPRPQAWGSFRHRLSLPPLSVSLLPKGRFVPAFFAFGGVQKTGNILLFYFSPKYVWLGRYFLLGSWSLDRQQTKGHQRSTLCLTTHWAQDPAFSSLSWSIVCVLELRGYDYKLSWTNWNITTIWRYTVPIVSA